MQKTGSISMNLVENLYKNKDKVAEILCKIYPNDAFIINYHKNQELPFNEWFSFIFNNHLWKLVGPIEIKLSDINVIEDKLQQLKNDFNENKYYQDLLSLDFSKTGYITVIKKDEFYSIIDGYHRYYSFLENNIDTILAYQWVKETNDNPLSLELKKLLISN